VATEVKLPRLGQGMESGTIVKWLKSEGDAVEKGEPLYELDTDKVTQEVEAEASGVLLKIAVQDGEVEVGRTIALIGEQGETAAESTDGDSARVEVEATPTEEGSPGAARDEERERGRGASTEAQPQPDVRARIAQAREGIRDGRVKASPLARRIARERGVDLARLEGTGPEGRIVAEDVERAAASAPAEVAPVEVAVEEEKLSSLRRTIARRMTEAWQAPAFQLTLAADMSRARELHERFKETAAEDAARPTYSDLLTKVCAVALMRHPAVNAQFAGETIQLFPTADIGIAVAIPDGLVVPVTRSCERKSLAELAAARTDLVSRAREGKLRAEDLEGGTFTISNLGMYGIEQFTAVLNPPQAAILAVGAIQETPIVVGGAVEARPLISMTLTCDHRALDGATAADFLRTVKTLIEEPGFAL
jgi:pyruvate dehydrogenase E2 component (dihydrolipoamide acetyltransferase)